MPQSAHSSVATKAWKIHGSDVPIIVERYQILGVLGEGGMGTVFKGYHLNLKRHVAIKTLRIDHRHSPKMVSRFLKEMESVGQMDHPNVVRASDAGEKNGVFYLVMEYLHGSDLSRLVSKKGPLEIAAACELTRQAALGLDHIHRTLIHRDIKPSNLMLTTTGQVKILDLGLARLGFDEPGDREKTPDGCAVGTYAYMAPEQATSGAPIDGRADIYSLGCTLFKLLTGQPPYSAAEFDNAAKIINAHCRIPLTEVAAFGLVPEPLRPVLLKMMAKDPKDRYGSGREVVDALTPFGAENSLVNLLPASGEKETVDDVSVQPLPQPLPDEISRLTVAPRDTPPSNRSSLTVGATSEAMPIVRPRSWRPWAAGACVLVGLLAIFVWFAPTPAPVKRAPADVDANGWRLVDDLPPRQHHFLLDRKPFAISRPADDPNLFRWDEIGQMANTPGGGQLFLILGKTSQRHYSFEVALSQAPWTGEVGVFWGYREDEAVKNDKTHIKKGQHGPYFAEFQALTLAQDVGALLQPSCFLRRIKGKLRHNVDGGIAVNQFREAQQSVNTPRNGVAIMQIDIAANKPNSAIFNGFSCRDLYSVIVDNQQANPPESCEGAFGLVSLGHAATFRNARFIIHPNK